MWLNRPWRRIGMIQVLVVIVRFIRRYAIINIWWRRVMIDGRRAVRRLSRCRVAPRLRVIGGPGWWLRSGTSRPRGQNPAVGVVIMIWRLIFGRPGQVISGRHSHRMVVVALRIGQGDVDRVRLLGLRYPRRGSIKVRLRILSYVLVREIVLTGIYRVRGNGILIPRNDRVKIILAAVGCRGSALMQSQDRSADKVRAIYGQRVVVALKLFTPPVPGHTSISGANGNRVNRLSGDRSDLLRRDAGIDDALVAAVKIEVIDGRGLVVDMRDPICFDAKTLRMGVAEIPCRHKCEDAGAQAKIKTGTDGMALINEPDAGLIYRMGW